MADVDEGTSLPVSLVHDVAVLEVVHEGDGALYASVRQRADLFAVEHFPALAVELMVEIGNELRVEEVNEGIAHVAGVLRY